jgi:S-adenosylmethionine:tRNA ribosyltransferase-isomerase
MPLSSSLFDYYLPPDLIAQHPAARRDDSRLLLVDRAAKTISHRKFGDVSDFLHNGDVLLRNSASVLPARLRAQRATGGAIECFLLHVTEEPSVWNCLVKPARRLGIGATFAHSSEEFFGEIVAKHDDGSADVRFRTKRGDTIIDVANRRGEVPLPPYIDRPDNAMRALDKERYQTVYADGGRQVAVAAPTAGLHFTQPLLDKLVSNGVSMADVILHVGLGTFRPIATDAIDDHRIHRERYEIPVATQEALFSQRSGRRVAVGTTSVRSIEDFLSNHSSPLARAHVSEAGIFIYPPYIFRGVDALITNFHQPRSTLLCLVAAFLTPGSLDGITWLREIYAEAIAQRYRFFSYGDAMMIL